MEETTVELVISPPEIAIGPVLSISRMRDSSLMMA